MIGATNTDRVTALGLKIKRGIGLKLTIHNLETGIIRIASSRHQRISEGVTSIYIGRGQITNCGARSLVLCNRGRGQGDVRGALVHIRYRNREGLLKGQAALIRATNTDRVTALGLKIKRGIGLKLTIHNLETSIIRISSSRHQRISEGVASIHIRA